MFNIKNLTVGYKDKPVIKDINLYLNPGTITCIVGPNGSGKSTILKTLARLINPISGSFCLDDINLLNLSPKTFAKYVSVLITGGLVPDLATGRDIVKIGRFPHTSTLGQLKSDDYLVVEETLNIIAKDLKDKYFSQMSDGERQRILLARVIAQQADALLLDEPISYLDIKYKIEILDIIKALKQKNKTILITLHELNLVRRLADEVVLLLEDSYIAGKPAEILTEDNIARAYKLNPKDLKRYNINL